MVFEQLTTPELTPEEELTMKMNRVMPEKWGRTLVGEARARLLPLGDWSLHLQQSRDLHSGKVTSRFQVGDLRRHFPRNLFVEWSPDGNELTDENRPQSISVEDLNDFLDQIAHHDANR